MRLQYQLSNGSWIDCGDRTEEFLGYCVANRQRVRGEWVNMTKNEAINALLAGDRLRNDENDWYSYCRCGNAHQAMIAARQAATPPVKLVKCACGHTVPSGLVMSASLGTSCCDCYDRMSGC